MEYSETDVFWGDFLVSFATILAILANLKLNSKMWPEAHMHHHILSQYGHISHFFPKKLSINTCVEIFFLGKCPFKVNDFQIFFKKIH